jgi:peptide/nickel transport system substrate-binding protein
VKDKIQNLFLKKFHLPKSTLIDEALRKFSITEKLIFGVFSIFLCTASLVLLWEVNQSFLIEVPSNGGTITEGVIGLPRFINPVLSFSDADRDLTALTYSGLIKATRDGNLIPDLAESYSISEDGLTYTFTLKKNIYFHDKKPITTDDVLFTIQKAQDPSIKSPKRANWEGVVAEKIDERQIKLKLKQPYAPFLENATLGILPKHIWSGISNEEFQFSQYNVSPIGSGPFKIKSVEKNSAGIPIYYRLESFDKYIFGKPFIKNIVIRFYQNNSDLISAYENGSIESLANISPAQAKTIKEKGGKVVATPLPRIFALFFNQNQAPVLANLEVRQALNVAVNKQLIVNTVLNGEGIPIDSPIPPGLLQKDDEEPINTYADDSIRIDSAKKILESAGWKINPEKGVYEKTVKKVVTTLAFSISTSDAPELKATAEMLKNTWTQLGAKVDVKIFDIGELNQNVIRTRKYDSLLFGEIIGRDMDLFAFWHSSQRNDPGLNVALFTDAKVDKLLEEARTISNRDTRMEKYAEVEREIRDSLPAVFIYSPDFLYVVPKKLEGFDIGHITIPAERFLNISSWYVETDHIWKIFAPKN